MDAHTTRHPASNQHHPSSTCTAPRRRTPRRREVGAGVTPPALALHSRQAGAGAVTDLVESLLTRGTAVRMKVAGGSMWPCIRGGDVVTLVPSPSNGARLGDIVAVSPHPGQLVIHRLVDRTSAGPLTWGDAAAHHDAPVGAGAILGVVSRVQRAGRTVRFGLGPERLLIVWAQRRGWLGPLRGLAARLVRCARAMGREVAGCGPRAWQRPADAARVRHLTVPRGIRP